MKKLKCRHIWEIDGELIGHCRQCRVTKDFKELQIKAGIIPDMKLKGRVPIL